MEKNNDSIAYAEFTDAKPVTPPFSQTDFLLLKIQRDINPNSSQVFLKLFRLHAISLLVTLLVCPQFGLGPLGGGNGIMAIIMMYGPIACACFCSSIFFGSTLILAKLFMTQPEKIKASQHAGSFATAISSLSFGAFMLLDSVSVAVSVAPVTGILWMAVGGIILMLLKINGASRFRVNGKSIS
jgi:hypothetical protein